MTDQQLSQADVDKLAAEGNHGAIEQARLDHRLDDLLGIRKHTPKDGQWSEADVKRLFAERRYQEIADARDAGQLNDLLEGIDK